jgi:hypothetical protein
VDRIFSFFYHLRENTMKLNFKSVKEDVRKIGTALIVAGLISGFIRETSFFEVFYPILVGISLIALGAMED